MGHYLATSNPDAAAEIDNPPVPPDIGTWVVFKDRAGVSRMHRTEFPALVLGAQTDGSLILMVILESEDFKMEDRVPFRSHNQENFYWRHRRKSAVEEADADLEPRIKAIEDFLASEDKLGEVTEALGQRVETVEQVLASDEMEALEKRIAALEGKKKPGRKPKGK